MPSVSAHVAHTLSAHVDHVFGVMGNGNADFLDALHATPVPYRRSVTRPAPSSRPTPTTAPRGGSPPPPPPTAPGSRTRSPRSPRPCRRASRSCSSWATSRRPAPARGMSTRSPWPPRPARHVHRRPSGCRGHHDVIAIEHAVAYRTAVVLAIPYDVAGADAGDPRRPRASPFRRRSRPSPSGARRHRRALAGAERPFLLAGRGAWLVGRGRGARSRSPTPRARSPRRRRSAAGSSPTPSSTSASPAGSAPRGRWSSCARRTSRSCSAHPSTSSRCASASCSRRARASCRSTSAPAATHPHVARFVRGRRRGRGIRDRRPPRRTRRPADRMARVGRRSRRCAAREPGDGVAPDGRLDPRTVAARIGELLPEDRVVVSDGGHFIGWANTYWPVASPDRMLMVGTAFQSIGLGFPSCPAPPSPSPRRPSCSRRATAAASWRSPTSSPRCGSAGGRGIAVVWNDAAYSAEVQPLRAQGARRSADAHPRGRLRRPRRAVGAEGVVVRTLADLDRLASWAAERCGIPPLPAARLPHLGRRSSRRTSRRSSA